MATYITIADIRLVFGNRNVSKWSDPENESNGTVIANRQNKAMNLAEEYVNGKLRGKGYDIPFTTVPRLIKDITAKRAGWELYKARGIVDADPHKNSLRNIFDEVEKVLSQIISGAIRLDVVTSGSRKKHSPTVEEGIDSSGDMVDEFGVYVE